MARTFQLAIRTIIFIGLLLLLFTAANASPVTLVVTKTADTNDGSCDADCSLREAIAAAPVGANITFASPFFDSPQVITLSDAAGFQELLINKTLFITGKGADLLTIRRDPADAVQFRIFDIFDPAGVADNIHVSLVGMTISGGQFPTSFGGGGIRNSFSTLTLLGCAVTGNTTTLNGGGIYSTGNASVDITNCTIANNHAQAGSFGGAGIQLDSGKLSLANSTVSGNVKGESAGGSNNAGGLYVSGNATALSITDSTITDNEAANPGAANASGIYAASTLSVRDSIVAGNRNNANVPDVAGFFSSVGFNLIGNRGAVTVFTQASDQSGTAAKVLNPLLGPLAIDGGRTATHAILPGSPALDKGNAFGFNADQRGVGRPIDNPGAPAAPGGDESDIGAYEAPRFTSYVVTKTADTNDGVCDSDCSLREAIAAAPVGAEITFASPLFDTAQIITLSSTAGFQELKINRSVNITGPGADRLTIQRDPNATANYRIFETVEQNAIVGGITVGLAGLKISGGTWISSLDGGGGIRNAYGVLNVRNCWVTGNTSLANGGGIYSVSGTLNISNITVSSNLALSGSSGGGGIQVNGGNLSIVSSTISGNSKGFNSGGIDNAGGIYFSGPSFTLTSSTVTDNEVPHPASNNFSGILSVNGLTIGNTIVAANRSNSAVPDLRATVVTSVGYNLIGNRGTITSFNQPGDQTGTAVALLDPQLDALAPYGAATPTHRLRSTSPALDKGKAFGATADQRGRTRPFDIPGAANASDGGDIGAFELQTVTENAPVANNDAYNLPEDTLLTVNAPGVLANDTDANDDTLHVVLVGGTTHGRLTLNSDGSFAYQPNADFHGTDSFTYRANDGIANSSLATVLITVTPVNDLPAAAGESYSMAAGAQLTVAAPGVLANDTDVDGDVLTAVLTSNPSHGTATVNANGGFTYIPQFGFSGSDYFTYQDFDGQASSNIAIVNIEVSQGFKTVTKTADTNDGVCDADCSLREAIAAASAGDEIVFASPLFDSPQTITLSDTDGFQTLVINKNLIIVGPGANLLTVQRLTTAMRFRIFSTAGNGSIVRLQGMTITGGRDGGGGGGILNDTGNTLFINACQVTGSVAGVSGGGIRNVAGTLNITGSTVGGNLTLAGTGVGSGIHSSGGNLTITNSTISGNLVNGNSATDGGGGIWISGGTASIANSTIADNGGPNLSAGGIFVSGGATATLASTIVAGDRTNGTVPDIAVAGGTFVSQGFNLIGNRGAVTTFNQATDQTGTGAAVLDPKLDALNNYGGSTSTQALLPGSPARDQGKAFGTTTDQRTRTRPVDDPTASPAVGGDNSDIGSFEVQTAEPFAPVAIDDAYQGPQDTLVQVSAPGVLSNDHDPNGDALTAVLVTNPAHGSLTFNADGSFTFNPTAGFVGTDSFTYRVSDGTANSLVASVRLTIAAGNHPPVAGDDIYSTTQGVQLSVTAPGVLANDNDPDGNALTAVLVSGPANGALYFDADGGFTYSPNVGFNGTDSFTYQANDGLANSNLATVAIEVIGVNQPAAAADDSYSINSNQQLSVAAPGVLANDTDAEGDTLHAFVVSGTSHGALNLNTDGSFTYLPDPAFNGADAFTYRVNDGHQDSNIATVAITVQQIHLTVTKVADTNDGVCDGDCSLREALAAAEPGDQIVFASPLFDNPQTIALSDEFGQLSIPTSLTIDGPGADLLTVGNITDPGAFRIFATSGAADETVILNGMTVTGGGDTGGGGGVLNDGSSTLLITACQITGNIASQSGGGVRNVAGTLTITNSTIANNQTQSHFGIGNAIHSSGGNLNVVNSTISGNYGEGVSATYGGGGIWVSGGTAEITASTIAGNGTSGTISASGLLVSNGASATVSSSIIAGNRNNGANPDVSADGTLISQGYNLIGNVGTVTAFDQPGDVTGTMTSIRDPRLAPLGSYGGPTPTHALFFDSPAINQADPNLSLAKDQRGVARTIGGRADIGSYEWNFQFFADHDGPGGAGTLPNGFTWLPYDVRISASRWNSLIGKTSDDGSVHRPGGVVVDLYQIIDGALPPGLLLDQNTGEIAGTPTQLGIYQFTVKVTDAADGMAGAQRFVLQVFGPTSSMVSVSGRLTTADGNGIANARVSVTDQSGITRTGSSNGFGYYRLDNIASGQTVVIAPSAKRQRFTAQAISLTGDVTGLDFVGQ